MLIKNVAGAGRGLGVKGHGLIQFAPGEVKDVDDAIIAEAKKDPANAATLTEEGGLVVLDEMVADAKKAAAAAEAAKAEETKVEETAPDAKKAAKK